MKVSIIIPVYNVSTYIERCIKSVMSQTYQDIECILVNDATPDDSIAFAERLIADYIGPIKFQIISHEHNKGLSATRNTGADAATGDYLYFMDSDDEITPDCIQKLSSPILKDSTIEMVEGCYVLITTDNNKIISEQQFPRPQLEFSTPKAVRDFYFSKKYANKLAWNKLVKREFFLKNQLYFKTITEEDDFWHFHYNRFLSHLYIIPNITYKYYKHVNSLSTNSNRKCRVIFGELYAEIAKNLSPGDEIKEVLHFLDGFSLFYLAGPTTPTYKRVACHFLKILKKNHCFKKWLILKSIVILSKLSLTRNLIFKVGNYLKSLKKNGQKS